MNKSLVKLAGVAAWMVGSALSGWSATTTITPLAQGPDYVNGKQVYGAMAGSHQANLTFRWKAGATSQFTRPLSVKPDTSLNGELVDPDKSYTKGEGELPALFGGYTVRVDKVSAPVLALTVRTQFQDGNSNHPDFINYNLYHESGKAAEAEVSYQFYTAWLLAAQPSGPVELATIVKVNYAGGGAATRRVLVHDAQSDAYYISEASATKPAGTIDITTTRWARVAPDNLAEVGAFGQERVTTIDYIGIYVDTGKQTAGPTLAPFKSLNNQSISTLSYSQKEP